MSFGVHLNTFKEMTLNQVHSKINFYNFNRKMGGMSSLDVFNPFLTYLPDPWPFLRWISKEKCLLLRGDIDTGIESEN